MSTILRQSTEIKVRVGPFVDVTDGFTPETGVALSTADEAELLKGNGAATVDISGATWAAVTGADGWYDLTLTTSHTDTIGELVVVVHDDSVCLPVFQKFQVVEEAIYDKLFASSASLNDLSAASVNAEVDTALADYDAPTKAEMDSAFTEIKGATWASGTDTLEAIRDRGDAAWLTATGFSTHSAADVWAAATRTLTANTNLNDPTVAAIADAVLDELLSGHTTPGSLGQAISDVLTDTGTTLDGKIDTIDGIVDAILVDTGTTLPAQISGLNNISTAQVNTEVDNALADIGLDHLISSALPTDWATDVASGSVFDNIADDGTASYDRTTDSLQALRDRGDSAWVTGGGGGITQSLNIQPVLPTSIDLANTATVRLGLILVNALDDLPSTAEITPGTISIERKAIGGTSWSAVVTDAAMSEQAGMVYYDEVFDSGTGYAEGDSIRVTFKSISITADTNTHEVCDANGVFFQTEIRQTMRGTDSANTTTPPTAAAIRAEIDSNSTQLSAIVADTNELQGDWTNGGRLDTIIDELTTQGDTNESKIDTIDTNVDAVLVDTSTTIPSQITGLNDPTAAAIADAVWDEPFADHTTSTSFGAQLQDVYHADIQLTIDASNSQDEYTVTWFKNGQRITSGITSPTIQVVLRSSGSDLVASTSLTQIGSTGSYKYDESSNTVTGGEAALVVVTATIDGSSRSFSRLVGRDSTA